MSVQGMGDYDREAGYQRGSVTLEYETRKMTQDRGRLFQLDPMDINEANLSRLPVQLWESSRGHR